MFQTAGYPAHPPRFASYDYQTPPRTPHGDRTHTYYSPRQNTYTTTPPSKNHTRRASGDVKYTYTYTTTPQQTTPAYYTTPGYSSNAYYTSAQSTPQRRTDYVSGYGRGRDDTRYHRAYAHGDGKKHGQYPSSKHQSSRARYVYDGYGEYEYEHLHATSSMSHGRHRIGNNKTTSHALITAIMIRCLSTLQPSPRVHRTHAEHQTPAQRRHSHHLGRRQRQ